MTSTGGVVCLGRTACANSRRDLCEGEGRSASFLKSPLSFAGSYHCHSRVCWCVRFDSQTSVRPPLTRLAPLLTGPETEVDAWSVAPAGGRRVVCAKRNSPFAQKSFSVSDGGRCELLHEPTALLGPNSTHRQGHGPSNHAPTAIPRSNSAPTRAGACEQHTDSSYVLKAAFRARVVLPLAHQIQVVVQGAAFQVWFVLPLAQRIPVDVLNTSFRVRVMLPSAQQI